MAFRVVVCEVATGIVCNHDGSWYVSAQGLRADLEFANMAEAEAYCRRVRSEKPQLECHVYDAVGEHVAVWR